MPNAIAKFKKYTDLLDDVYQSAAKTAVLDSDSSLVRAGANANEIIIPKLTMDGLGDYSRGGGYVDGSVSLEHETVTFDYDRGRRFTVDAMDNEETAGLAFGKLSSEFIRAKVAPELDAYRFAKLSAAAGLSASGALADGAAALAALVAAVSAMDNAEVPEEGRMLFLTPALLNLIQAVDTTKSREILATFTGSIVKVPQARFYTAIDLKDGATAGEEAGGYAKAAAGKDINFMIVHKPAVIQISKHLVDKVITPEENQTSDGWLFFYRAYGLSDVFENKVSGIYVHSKA